MVHAHNQSLLLTVSLAGARSTAAEFSRYIFKNPTLKPSFQL